MGLDHCQDQLSRGPSSTSPRWRLSLRRFTSQLYTRAVFTSITVICSRRNSRSLGPALKSEWWHEENRLWEQARWTLLTWMAFSRFRSAAESFDERSSMASGSAYDSITLACSKNSCWVLCCWSIDNTVVNDAPRAIDTQLQYPRALPPHKACHWAQRLLSVVSVTLTRSPPACPLGRLHHPNLLLICLPESAPVKRGQLKQMIQPTLRSWRNRTIPSVFLMSGIFSSRAFRRCDRLSSM